MTSPTGSLERLLRRDSASVIASLILITLLAWIYLIVLALDMEMRRGSDGETGVLDLVRHLHENYAQRGLGFPEDGVLEIINEVAGSDLSMMMAASRQRATFLRELTLG